MLGNSTLKEVTERYEVSPLLKTTEELINELFIVQTYKIELDPNLEKNDVYKFINEIDEFYSYPCVVIIDKQEKDYIIIDIDDYNSINDDDFNNNGDIVYHASYLQTFFENEDMLKELFEGKEKVQKDRSRFTIYDRCKTEERFRESLTLLYETGWESIMHTLVTANEEDIADLVEECIEDFYMTSREIYAQHHIDNDNIFPIIIVLDYKNRKFVLANEADCYDTEEWYDEEFSEFIIPILKREFCEDTSLKENNKINL